MEGRLGELSRDALCTFGRFQGTCSRTALWANPCRLWVKSGKVQTEQMFSGLCLKADATLERGREFWQAFGRRSVRSLFSGLNLADLHSGQRPRPDAFGQASLDLVEIAIGEPIEPT